MLRFVLPVLVVCAATLASGALEGIPAEELARRGAALESRHERFNPDEMLVKRYVGSTYNYNYYARDTDVHHSLDSLRYAVALLDSYDDAYVKRAQQVIRRAIGLQVVDPEHQHYGVWPWLMEEPVGEGPYVDRNTADFCGKELLHVLTHHRERLETAVVDEAEASLRRAVEAIRIRNVGPGYTNIAVMGALVTLLSGEALDDAEIVERGLKRVRDFHAYTMEVGTFEEYNSPTYTMVVLRDLATFRHHVRNPEGKPLVEDLFRVAWETVAKHFHPATRQWVGPSSRNYSVFVSEDTLRFIEQWTGAAVDFGYGEPQLDPAWACMDARCPEDLERLMAGLKEPRSLVQTVKARATLPLVATTYLAPDVALGSINHQDMWNQRRNVIAFWGSHKNPSYCRVRLLYDGYDLATGAIWTRQEGNRVLGIVTFATDGGGKHVSLDRLKEGVFEAEELCLRFEFGGAAALAPLRIPKTLTEPVLLDFDGIPVQIHVPFAAFGDSAPHWRTGHAEVDRVGRASYLDISLYQGEKRSIRLKDMEQAAVAFVLQVGGGAVPLATAALDADVLRVDADTLGMSVPIRPATYEAMRRAFKAQ